MGIKYRRGRNVVLRAVLAVTVIAATSLVLWDNCAIAAPVTPPREDRTEAGGAPAREVKSALDTVFRDARIQRDLPEDEKKPQKLNLGWLAPLFEILGWLLLASLVIGVAVLIFLLLRRRFGFTQVRDDAASGAAEGTGAARTGASGEEAVLWGREALAEADRLARQGDFAEAIHVLLIGGLADLRRRLARALPPSLTSREILARIEMPEAAREALAVMITLVELSRFGFRPVDAADYGRCRDRFLAFAEAEEGRV